MNLSSTSLSAYPRPASGGGNARAAASSGGASYPDLLFLNFNQDYSCLSVGTRQGFKIYNCDPFGKCYSKYDGGIGIVEMLFCTSLVALVGAGEQPAFSPRRLQIVNTKRESTICELNFVTAVLAVKLNRKRLVVILEEHIHVYDVNSMKILHTIDTAPNPNAICALSPSSDNCFIAYPANNSTGEVLIFDAISLQTVNILQAHRTPLAQLSFNYDGTMLATASDKGTVVRVFSIPDAQRLYQFRRGSMPAHIYSIVFNLQSNMLVVTSDTDTVHVFKLARYTGLRGAGGAVGMMGSYLPEMVTEMLEPVRDFARLKLPVTGVPCIAALCNNVPQVMVASADGYFLVYNIDLENGGECVLLRQYSFVENAASLAPSPTSFIASQPLTSAGSVDAVGMQRNFTGSNLSGSSSSASGFTMAAPPPGQ